MTQFLTDHHIYGVAVGLATFLIIGIFHPLVIKGEYYLGKRICRSLFLIFGIITLIASLLIADPLLSVLLGVTSFSSFWGIGEVNEQERRVARGWFPRNPRRK
ncbi:MAG: DUF4491 family protein [Muribaculaceae bacterium]|nr:DUF4491 family protein [Muribaculaceae bacterium]